MTISSASLPPGRGMDRLRLWDREWRLIWDAVTAITPAYAHINTWVNATIDHPDGARWSGRMYRTPNGIERYQYQDQKWLKRLTTWPSLRLEELEL